MVNKCLIMHCSSITLSYHPWQRIYEHMCMNETSLKDVSNVTATPAGNSLELHHAITCPDREREQHKRRFVLFNWTKLLVCCSVYSFIYYRRQLAGCFHICRKRCDASLSSSNLTTDFNKFLFEPKEQIFSHRY